MPSSGRLDDWTTNLGVAQIASREHRDGEVYRDLGPDKRSWWASSEENESRRWEEVSLRGRWWASLSGGWLPLLYQARADGEDDRDLHQVMDEMEGVETKCSFLIQCRHHRAEGKVTSEQY